MECKIDGVPSGSVDLEIRVVSAPDHEAAYTKALFLGSRAEHSYPTTDGGKVSWEFKGLHELDLILSETLEDGTEIWNRLSQGDASKLVREKGSLATFWVEANGHRKASDLLEADDA